MKRFLAFVILCTVFFAFLPFPGVAGAGGPPQSVIDPPPQVVTPGPCGITDCPCGCENGFACTCATAVVKADKKGGEPKEKKSSVLNYAAGYVKAVKENKPLVVYVYAKDGYPAVRPWARKVKDWVVCQTWGLEGTKGFAVVVAKPDGGGGLVEVATLPLSASEEDVASALKPRSVPQAVAPPQNFFVPQPMFRGGFGGGRRGGC